MVFLLQMHSTCSLHATYVFLRATEFNRSEEESAYVQNDKMPDIGCVKGSTFYHFGSCATTIRLAIRHRGYTRVYMAAHSFDDNIFSKANCFRILGKDIKLRTYSTKIRRIKKK